MKPQGESVSPAEVFAQALAAGPLNPDEIAEFNSRRAAEMARAEARRQPSPQSDLDLAA